MTPTLRNRMAAYFRDRKPMISPENFARLRDVPEEEIRRRAMADPDAQPMTDAERELWEQEHASVRNRGPGGC
jgi:hypothetical protein